MLNWKPASDRWKLGLKEAVLANFDYLASYGLECVESDVTHVRYDSPKVFVNVYHGRGSYELNVEIGRHDGPRKDSSLSLDAVLGWKRAPERKVLSRELPLFQSHTREGVQEMVPKMAALFRKYADPLLRGDEGAFKSFDDHCTIESHRLGEHYRSGTTRWKADMAWQRKEWQQVIEAYESIRDDLSQTEEAELAYAQDQVRLAEGHPVVSSGGQSGKLS
ncbi:MAG: hypothetical protein WAN23_00700 [Candidatus Acidiferrales bacterium]